MAAFAVVNGGSGAPGAGGNESPFAVGMAVDVRAGCIPSSPHPGIVPHFIHMPDPVADGEIITDCQGMTVGTAKVGADERGIIHMGLMLAGQGIARAIAVAAETIK